MRFNITNNKTIAVNGTALPFHMAITIGQELSDAGVKTAA